MIEIFEGRIGGGKTYTAVERIANVLAMGQVVCTNVKLKFDGLQKMLADRAGVLIEPDQVIIVANDKIGEFHRHIPWGDLRGSGKTRVLVVVDEAHLYFNARDWAKTSKEMLAFLTQSDKVSVDIIFISQSILNIDKQFRTLAQFVWRFRDLAKWKIAGLGIAWPLNQILQCQYDYDGVTLLHRWFRWKNTQVFGCYETAALLTEDFQTLEELSRTGKTKTNRQLRTVKKKAPTMVKIIILIAVIAAAVCAYAVKDKYNTMAHPADASGKTDDSKSPALHGSSSPSVTGSPKTEKPKGAYDIYDERFVAWNGAEHALKTDEGWYQVGEMSNRGFVLAASDRRAKVNQPDGRTAWVVARDQENAKNPPSTPVAMSSPKNSPSPSPSPTPQEETLSDREQKRIRANLAKRVESGREY